VSGADHPFRQIRTGGFLLHDGKAAGVVAELVFGCTSWHEGDPFIQLIVDTNAL
jgi:hypothetical protein